MTGPGWAKRQWRMDHFKDGIDCEFSYKPHEGTWGFEHVDLHVWGADGKIDKKKSKDGFRVEGWDF